MTALGLNADYQSYPSAAVTDPAEPSPGETIARLNAFFHGEVSAVEAYGAIVDRLAESSDGVPYRGVLCQFQEEHQLAVDVLRQCIEDLGGAVMDNSGSWGAWRAALQCSSSLFKLPGDQNACIMECLRDGETQTLETYVSNQSKLEPSAARILREQLIPAQQRHARMLRELLGQTSEA